MIPSQGTKIPHAVGQLSPNASNREPEPATGEVSVTKSPCAIMKTAQLKKLQQSPPTHKNRNRDIDIENKHMNTKRGKGMWWDELGLGD